MKFLTKPKNRWGWVRIGGWIVLALMLVFTALAAVYSWWSGWKVYSLLDRFELVVIPLLAVIAGGWLEEHDHRAETEQHHRRAAEQAAADRRADVLARLREDLLAALPEGHHLEGVVADEIKTRINEMVRAALPDLDGKGRGGLLHILHERGLLRADEDEPVVRFFDVDLSGTAQHKAHFKGIHLEGADLSAAQLDGAQLSGSRLSVVNLKKAFLRHADLREVSLWGSSLTRARLEHANLEGADLTGAGLENANLSHANLKGASGCTPEALDAAILIDTLLPDGRKLTNEKGKEYLRKKEIEVLVDRL